MKKVKSILSLFLAVLMVTGCLVTGYAATPVDETEGNNDIATANAIQIGGSAKGVLDTATDEDWFSFKATKPGLATVTFSHTAVAGADNTMAYFMVEVKDNTGAVLAEISSTGADTQESAKFSVAENVNYYVTVKAGTIHSSTLVYNVAVAHEVNVRTESEPNDTKDKADVLEYSPASTPKEYYGSIGADDVDYYKVTFPSTGAINLYLYNYTSNSGNLVASLQKYVEGVSGADTLTEVTKINIKSTEESKVGPSVCVPAGDYILVISGAEGSTGSYKTRVLFRAVSGTETEINDTAADANAINVGQTLKATIDEASDKDFYRFSAPEANNGYIINFKSTKAGQWKVTLLDSNSVQVGEVLSVTATDTNKTAKIETAVLKAGVYYIKVECGGALDTDIYEINVLEKAADKEDDKGDSDADKNLFDKIGSLDWGAFWDNFSGWIEEINFFGMILSLGTSLLYGLTKLFSTLG